MIIGSSSWPPQIDVITAALDLDGMCRPDDYQDFVFVRGRFAGTLSPQLMESRGDGSSGVVRFTDANKFFVSFKRYTDRDPLCCASRISEASFEIRYQRKTPVVVLTGVETRTSDR